MNLQLTYIKCPLCGADDSRIIFPAKNKKQKTKQADLFNCTNNNLGQYNNDIVKCNKCEMIYSNPQPDQNSLYSAYKDVVDNKYLEETKARVKTFNLSLNQLNKFIQLPGNLLDIGCYTGVFMETARNQGWKVSGIELSDWARDIAISKKIGEIYNKPLNKLQIDDESFDLITLWDVIEHLSNPKQIFKELVDLLKPKGILAISTHFIDSLPAKIFGRHYPFLMDMHLSHFSKKTIKKMLENSGLEIIEIFPHKRILRSGYFFNKLSDIVPIGGSIIKKLNNNKLISEQFIHIGMLGLKNIYCRKIK